MKSSIAICISQRNGEKEKKKNMRCLFLYLGHPCQHLSLHLMFEKNTICRRSHPKPLLHVSGRDAAADADADPGSQRRDVGDRRRHRGSPGRHRRRRLGYITEYQNAVVADHQDDTSFPSLHLTPPARFRRALTAIDDPLHPTCPGPDAARTKRRHRCIDLRCDACHHH